MSDDEERFKIGLALVIVSRLADYWRTVALWGWALFIGTLIAGGLLAGYWWANR